MKSPKYPRQILNLFLDASVLYTSVVLYVLSSSSLCFFLIHLIIQGSATMTHRSIICFCKYHFIGIQSCLFIYILFIAALPQQQSWVVPRVHTAQSLKYLLAGSWTFKFVIPCRMHLEPLSSSVHRASLIRSMTKYPTAWLYTIMYQNLLTKDI